MRNTWQQRRAKREHSWCTPASRGARRSPTRGTGESARPGGRLVRRSCSEVGFELEIFNCIMLIITIIAPILVYLFDMLHQQKNKFCVCTHFCAHKSKCLFFSTALRSVLRLYWSNPSNTCWYSITFLPRRSCVFYKNRTFQTVWMSQKEEYWLSESQYVI